jgi:myosin-9
VFVGALSPEFEALSIEALKSTTADEMVSCIVDKLQLPLPLESYELAEVVGNAIGQECKERRLAPQEQPVALMLLWPKLGPPPPPQYPPPLPPSASLAGSSRERQQLPPSSSSVPAKRTTSKSVIRFFF